MALSNDDKQHIEDIAEDSLNVFEQVGNTAKNALRYSAPADTASLASVNTMTSTTAVQNLKQIHRTNIENYKILAHEPAIARVVVIDEEGVNQIYYISRATPISTNKYSIASYRAPVGRLASLSIGDEYDLPNGKTVEVIENSRFHPCQVEQKWDSRDTVIIGEKLGPVTIESFRALLEEYPEIDQEDDLLEQILAEETESLNIIEGVRRSVITKMGLRDQPILDKYQDEIFRLPLGKCLLILGPPGTGKTTTLIRRLGQKLDTGYLQEDEQNRVEVVGLSTGQKHDTSWLMFTPTELLKQYLKEAFAREGVPASDQRIRTWPDYRRVLGKNIFGVLKTASGTGTFILKDSDAVLTNEAFDNSIDWFTDFNNWQRHAYIDGLRKSASILSKIEADEISIIGKHLLLIVERANTSTMKNTLTLLVNEVNNIQHQLVEMKAGTDKVIKDALRIQLNSDKTFIDELASFLDEIHQTPDIDFDEQEDQDVDQDMEEDETETSKTPKGKAITIYIQTVRAQARAYTRKSEPGKNTRTGKVLTWLGDRTLKDDELEKVGRSLLIQASLRRFVNPVKAYIDRIPARYRTFRRARQKEKIWYNGEDLKQSDIHPLELDIVLLAILKNGNELLNDREIIRKINSPTWSPLKSVHDLYMNQILVDEVTDFSPIQIACMAALAHPRIRSFFACGDFNQRLTTWGSRSLDELEWVLPDIEYKEVTVSYRQSRQLNDLAHAIIKAVGGVEDSVTLPVDVDNEGVAPVLLENAPTRTAVIDWLANRIREIERFMIQLPSIAIFVDNEEEVVPLSAELNEALASENTQVVACSNGQVMGQDNDVRVFDVQHIKGLEFEAVFFIGVDHLAIQQPQLFDKYLYVGTTRAATYLGITCENNLPEEIAILRPMFSSEWNSL